MASEIFWIRDDIVISIHRRQLAEHGGLDGIRDHDLLKSALSRPKNLFYYSDPQPDISALAASYAYAIAKNHPFLDGNKRTAFVLLILFLKLNGFNILAPYEDKYQTIMKLASSNISEEEFVAWVREKITRL